jgi:hypothetical protein
LNQFDSLFDIDVISKPVKTGLEPLVFLGTVIWFKIARELEL